MNQGRKKIPGKCHQCGQVLGMVLLCIYSLPGTLWFDCLTGYVLDSQRWKGFSQDTQVGSRGVRILDIKVVFWDWAVPDIIPAGQLTCSAYVLMLVLEARGAVIKKCISDVQLWEMRWERVNRWFAVPSRTLLTFVQENNQVPIWERICYCDTNTAPGY